jgi:hypothetical protein
LGSTKSGGAGPEEKSESGCSTEGRSRELLRVKPPASEEGAGGGRADPERDLRCGTGASSSSSSSSSSSLPPSELGMGEAAAEAAARAAAACCLLLGSCRGAFLLAPAGGAGQG